MAIHYYKQASMRGDAESSRKLADIYEVIDVKQAWKWHKKAAEQASLDEWWAVNTALVFEKEVRKVEAV